MLRINCSTRAYGETGSAESTTRGALATLATNGPTDQGHDLMANIVFPRPIGDLYVSSPTNQVQKYKQPTAADCLTAGVPCQGPKWGTSYVSSRNKSSPKTQNATNKTKHKTWELFCVVPSTTTWGLFCVVPSTEEEKKKPCRPDEHLREQGCIIWKRTNPRFPSTTNQVVPPTPNQFILREQTNSRVYTRTPNHSLFSKWIKLVRYGA